MIRIIFLSLFAGLALSALAADPFRAASVGELPLDVKMLEQQTENRIAVKRFYFTSVREGGVDYRIYAVYAAPVGPGRYPVLLHLHGGGQTADPQLVRRWAERGYACLSFDWTGDIGNRADGKREYSRLGATTARSNNDSMFPEQIAESRVRHIQLAARRALLVMGAFPEADLDRLGVIGLSWGGFSALLLGETLPRVKAVTDIYGGGFFTGAYQLTGPLIYRSENARRAWLKTYDPGVRIKALNAPVLMITGLNDIFVPLRQFQQLYRELPGDKHLVLVPNNNHALAWDFIDLQARPWFDHYLKGQPVALPVIAGIEVTPKTVKGRIETHGQPLQRVALHYTWCSEALRTGEKSRWETRGAELLKENFLAELPQVAPAADRTWLNYCIEAVTASGAVVSTAVSAVRIETVAAAAPSVSAGQKPAADNFFGDPSLEKQRSRGFSGKVFFNYTGEYVRDDSGKFARSGQAAVHLSGRNQLIMEAKGIEPGRTYCLSGWFRGAGKSSSANLRVNWMKNGKFVKTALFIGKAGPDTYGQLRLTAPAPEGTTSAILFFNAADAWVDDLEFIAVPPPAAQ